MIIMSPLPVVLDFTVLFPWFCTMWYMCLYCNWAINIVSAKCRTTLSHEYMLFKLLQRVAYLAFDANDYHYCFYFHYLLDKNSRPGITVMVDWALDSTKLLTWQKWSCEVLENTINSLLLESRETNQLTWYSSTYYMAVIRIGRNM